MVEEKKANEMVFRIVVPEGIEYSIEGKKVTIKGPKGELNRVFDDHRVTLESKDKEIIISAKPVNKPTRAILMTSIAHIKNMIMGAKYAWKYELQVSYSHFPMTVEKGDGIVLVKNFLGEKHPRSAKIVGNTQVDVKGQDVVLTGFELEDVSQTAANIEQVTRVRGKDIRRFSDGIYLTNKGNQEEVEDDYKVEVIRGRE
jgi:large subunit ribosomal protein L6